MLMIRLKDKKEIYFLSTIHNTAVNNTNKKNKDGEIVSKLTFQSTQEALTETMR